MKAYPAAGKEGVIERMSLNLAGSQTRTGNAKKCEHHKAAVLR